MIGLTPFPSAELLHLLVFMIHGSMAVSLGSILLLRGIKESNYSKLSLSTGFYIGAAASIVTILLQVFGLGFLALLWLASGLAIVISWMILLLTIIDFSHRRPWYYATLFAWPLSVGFLYFLPTLASVSIVLLSFAVIAGFAILYVKVRRQSLLLTIVALIIWSVGGFMSRGGDSVPVGLAGIVGYSILFMAFQYIRVRPRSDELIETRNMDVTGGMG